MTQVLDFGASRDRIPADRLGTRIVVDSTGEEVGEDEDPVEHEGSET